MDEDQVQEIFKPILSDHMQDEAIDDVDNYFQPSTQEKNDFPVIRVLEDSGSELPMSDQQFEYQREPCFEDIRLEKLHIQSVHSDGRATSWSHTDDNNSLHQHYLPKLRTRQQLNSKIVENNQELFNVHYAKSLYTSKISKLVDKQITTNPKANRLSRSQQKQKRKSSQQFNETSDVSEHKSSLQSGGELSEDRLARNRVAAKNSRARKRLYFELLETKVKDLQDEIERLNELCQTQAKQLQKYRECDENFYKSVEVQQQLISMLEVCQLKDEDMSQTKDILNQLKQCQLGQDKSVAANQYVEKILEVLLPIETKYIVYSYDQNKDILSDFQNSYFDWMKQTLQLVDLKQDQLRKIKKQKEKLNSVKKSITNCINNLYTSVKQIITETQKVDSIWQIIYYSLEPKQIRSILLAIHLNSHRPAFENNCLFSDWKSIKPSSQGQDDQNLQRPSQLRQYVKRNN